MHPLPRYQQLAAQLAAAIEGGTLGAGSRLPSVRACAGRHALSLNTVTAAYRLLEDQGLVEARPQSGYYVKSALAAPPGPLNARPALRDAPPATQQTLVDRVLAAQGRDDHLDLALACPHGAPFYPVERLARLTGTLLRQAPGLIGRYALPPGSPRLRAQIARRALDLGMRLSPDDIVLTHGTMEALQLALRAVTRPGDTVGVESPTYFNLYPLLESLGLKVLELPTDPQQGLSLDALEMLLSEGRLAALVAMPTVHNPLGCTMPLPAKQRLARLVNQYRVPLIEDALYAELQFADVPSPAVKAFDEAGWVMVCASYSKTLAPDYRVGYLEAGRFGDAVRRLKFASSIAEPMLLGEVVGEFLENGGYDRHLRALRRLYAQQVDTVRGLVARHFPAGTTATRPSGGFLLWLQLPPSVDTARLAEAALAERIVVMPGTLYSAGSRYRHCLRLTCCRALDERFVAALVRLGALAQAQAAASA